MPNKLELQCNSKNALTIINLIENVSKLLHCFGEICAGFLLALIIKNEVSTSLSELLLLQQQLIQS